MRRQIFLLGSWLFMAFLGIFPIACGNNNNPSAPKNTITPTNTQTFTPTSSVTVTTLAGSGFIGATNATGIAASFDFPTGVAVDTSGNVYVADYGNNLIRKINLGGAVSTLAGGGVCCSTNGTGTAASFSDPEGVAVDASGNVYVADEASALIRKITPGGAVTTLAGGGSGTATNGPGTIASFSIPEGVAVDSSGNVYVADTGNSLIRKITPGGAVTTLAGSGSNGASNATGTAASFYYPQGVAVDASGNVYVADSANALIRKITPGGVVTTLAGGGPGTATNATGTAASFDYPEGVAVDSSGNVYVADGNSLIRKITSAGVVTTLAGGGTGTATNGSGSIASFSVPRGVAVDGSGNVYVADTNNNLIREIQ